MSAPLKFGTTQQEFAQEALNAGLVKVEDGRVYKLYPDGEYRTREWARNGRGGKNSYQVIGLYDPKAGVKRTIPVHVIIFVAAYGVKKKMTVDHKDGNHFNNAPDNLEAVSQKENARRYYAGTDAYKYSDAYYLDMGKLHDSGISVTGCAMIFGCSVSTAYTGLRRVGALK